MSFRMETSLLSFFFFKQIIFMIGKAMEILYYKIVLIDFGKLILLQYKKLIHISVCKIHKRNIAILS